MSLWTKCTLSLTLVFTSAVFAVERDESNASSERQAQIQREAERATIQRERVAAMFRRHGEAAVEYNQRQEDRAAREANNADNAARREGEQRAKAYIQADELRDRELNERPVKTPKRELQDELKNREQQRTFNQRETEALTEEQLRKRADSNQEQAREEARRRNELK